MIYNTNPKIFIISRESIPDDIYLCAGNNKDYEWELIHLFEFENGLKFVIGANRYIKKTEEIIEIMKHEMEYIIYENNTPEQLQDYFYYNCDNFVKYKDCVIRRSY